MKILRTAEPGKGPDSSVITLGVYDGVHAGHRKIISEVAGEGRRRGIPSAAVTFTPHPGSILSGEPPGLITTEEEKLEILESCGLDLCLILSFTEEFSRKTAGDFVREIIAGFMKAEFVAVGFNHAFGAGRRGGARLLSRLGGEYGFRLRLINPVRMGGQTVSSSGIRDLIRRGNVEKAGLFLGRSFSVEGKVKRGEGLGAVLGFPTANLDFPPGKIEPAPGVYSGVCFIGEDAHPAAFYTGYKPTFGGRPEKPSHEVHVIGFSGRLYGRKIRFSFISRLRADIKFENKESLKKRLAADIGEAAAAAVHSPLYKQKGGMVY